MGRKEWKYWWRWKRKKERELASLEEADRKLLLRDDIAPELKMRIAENIINPPLLVPPWA